MTPALVEDAVRVARIARLRAYDAVYVPLALTRSVATDPLGTPRRVGRSPPRPAIS